MHSGNWTNRGKDKKNLYRLGVFMILSAIIGWFFGKDVTFAGVLVTNAMVLITAVEINHTYQKRKHDESSG